MLQNQVVLMLGGGGAVRCSPLPGEAQKVTECVLRQERSQGERVSGLRNSYEYFMRETLRALLKGTRSLEDVTDTRRRRRMLK